MYQNIREEELKNKVGKDYFSNFDTTKIVGNVDFCVTFSHLGKQEALFEDETRSLLWAEAKRGKADIYNSIVQLILTIGKARTFDKELPPSYLGAFDSEKIAFIPYNFIQEVFCQNDFNWNVTPSNYETKEFKLIHEKVQSTIESSSLLFNFGTDDLELKQFIKTNFVVGNSKVSKIQVDKNNFISIYSKWLQQVKPSIAANWESAKKFGIIDGDFYLADLLSNENETLKDKLYVLLKKNYYELARIPDESGFFTSKTTNFSDNQKAHTTFWNKYERPPKESYWDYIVERRDLLVPQDVRERKGSFFTPQIWVEKSQEYLTSVLGENWQDEYYIWDCAAGTGNLLTGLTNKYNIYASTLDKQDVDVMHQRIETMNQNSVSGNGANLLQNHVFQFDFLNDEFTKLPQSLQDIIADEEKRKKLVIYINPPYAEATSGNTVTGTGKNKTGVSTDHRLNDFYNEKIGNATNEIFALFMARIYDEISGCKLAQFSKLKFVNGSNFKQFKKFFLAKYLGGFIAPGDTFDNVKGHFPIGFTVWDLSQKEEIKTIQTDVFDKTANFEVKKSFYGDLPEIINKWIVEYRNKLESIGYLTTRGNDFQNNNFIQIIRDKDLVKSDRGVSINKNNLIPISIYLAVRHVFEATWLNDRDQFLYPSDGWQKDTEFQNNCLTFALFHGQNRITSGEGINNWIPFTENEVNAKEKFASNFMTQFMGGKLGDLVQNGDREVSSTDALFGIDFDFVPSLPLKFSLEAQNVFDAGRELWRYYHEMAGGGNGNRNNSNWEVASTGKYNPNASLYDIREYFQGRNGAGKMNNKSLDLQYTGLIGNLRERLKLLALKIQPKVYEFGFLKG